MEHPTTTHLYPIGRALSLFAIGGVLFVASLALLFSLVSKGALGWIPYVGVFLGASATWLGWFSLRNRKKFPMTLEDDQITFYVRGKVVMVPTAELVAVFYNTRGIDKRATLRTRSGDAIDLPVLYGLNDLVKKLGARYNLPMRDT